MSKTITASSISRQLRAAGINVVPTQHGAEQRISVQGYQGGVTLSIAHFSSRSRRSTLAAATDVLVPRYALDVQDHEDLGITYVYITPTTR